MAAIIIIILQIRTQTGREIIYLLHRHMVINSQSSTRKNSSILNLKCFPLILAFFLLLEAYLYFTSVSFSDSATALP